ncbi:hypothetical protein [Methylobacterium haplocladii]|uniref:Uncharacterized protein n=1 Tax=Methylobacterium haplocladii TaxID=1176176 RepID=A0A512ISA7_9HYPH|nr:hypothetical protein [Methylobacterium haplocladii]GEP00592.1 hypothetical protein MHA02_29790 [Methylobacterium haplocladii]GJD85507.1 hypothetical protein HPGCJGGD_3396 [Methylobacterium haplocladii]GLS57740.1 hypothetical protein GCM10007887_03960 [Methylobacterium haplocladii]
MTAPSLITAARNAPDARDRILEMAVLMQEHRFGPEGGCTDHHLEVAGFTRAEIEVYANSARAVLARRPSELRTTRPGRVTGRTLAKRAEAIRARIKGGGRG